MKPFSKLAKAASLICGLAIACLSFVWFWIGASGALEPSPSVGYFAGVGFLFVAAPLLAFPFHRPSARFLAVFALLSFACTLLWLAFRPGQPLERPVLAQVGAIALVVLLVARIGLAWYRRRTRLAA
jgi:hypothetical protein